MQYTIKTVSNMEELNIGDIVVYVERQTRLAFGKILKKANSYILLECLFHDLQPYSGEGYKTKKAYPSPDEYFKVLINEC